MTAIGGKISTVKRPGELGVHSMDTFKMFVPDWREAEGFYKTFGLDVREEGNSPGIYTFGSSQRWASLAEGQRKKLNLLSSGVFEEDFEPMRKRIEAQGLRLPDRSGDGICFKLGIHGSDHHMIAFAKSSAPGLHHRSWDAGSINETGRGAMQMPDNGSTKGRGVGRHVLGSNYFHYVHDPWGSYSEYSADIDYIPSTCDWDAGDYPPEDSIYLWGPEIPKDFIVNHEAQG